MKQNSKFHSEFMLIQNLPHLQCQTGIVAKEQRSEAETERQMNTQDGQQYAK